MHYSQN